ncbi:DNA gyrase subunit B [Kitasatospora gansuensis]|uniref:DNA topoisomerase (ATP-hydrolyzing) n=1 Tax=Kitasatospora gansuensis TaxID=258050 RepID=A0A7W7SHK3_9ACTN|nr:ATP-binding protein [Kitasatospora gansuensis]MBB4950197.1 DNA gyrase subunit B [Kitasatospora gansuensis]
MSDGTNVYDASRIQVLEGLDAVRKRPGMYIGSTGERGLHELVFGLVNLAVNEVLAGHGSRVGITLTRDGGVCVADDGRGIPVEDAGAGGGSTLEARLTRLSAGTRFGGRRDVVLCLSYGEPCVANALSRRMTAEVHRGGVRWVQEYERGVAVTPLVNAGAATGSGTALTFWPDADIFETVEPSFEKLAERFRELALLNRELEISVTDQRSLGKARAERFQYPGGVRDFVAHLDAEEAPGAPQHVITIEQEDPRMAGAMEVAFRWRDSGEERVRSYANSWLTHGGSHELGFCDGVVAAVTAYARGRQLLTATDPDLGTERIGEGLTAVVSVKLDDPAFEGSTRDVLGNSAARTCVGEAVREHFGRWLAEHPEQAAVVVGRIIASSRRG